MSKVPAGRRKQNVMPQAVPNNLDIFISFDTNKRLNLDNAQPNCVCNFVISYYYIV